MPETPTLLLPADPEAARLAVLRECAIMDTPPEAGFDELALLAAQLCKVPIALITFLDADRQWFKSRIGLDVAQTPRVISFCTHAIQQEELFVVPDAAADARFSSNPLVTDTPHIRFYAGAPVVTAAGAALGTLCVIDRVPRDLTEDQRLVLRVLARHVSMQCELRRTIAQRGHALEELEMARERLEQRVAERTAELRAEIAERKIAEEKSNAQLEELRRWYRATLGREDRVRELKCEVNELRRRLGDAPAYPSVTAEAAEPCVVRP